ncbi:glycosyltransferase 87 family protein [Knoellia koreensis]|uniref:DUF2029 domain-containing protein n=1 Tax=Knoellia koreensis TaxID=2730921 RepID=A0A849HP10_9MICO|nr:DUF2029 domain-containing protein [Knoellia sp. DB2414S]
MPWSNVDLGVYLAGARAALTGDELYSVSVSNGHGGLLEFSYPPFAALCFAPLTALSTSCAGVLMAMMSLASLGVVAAVAARSVGIGARGTLLVVLVALTLEPVQRTLLFGQVNLILAALVMIDAFLLPRRWRGLLTGLAAGIKLTPAIFLMYFVLRRDWSSAGRLVVAAVGTVVAAWLVMPHDSARFWFEGLGSMSQFGPEVVLWGNQSLDALARRALQGSQAPGWARVAFVAPAALGLFLLTVHAAKAQLQSSQWLSAFTAVAIFGLLISPVSWTHHWVWVVPALVVMVQRRWWWGAGLTAGLFYVPPMWVLHSRPDDQQGYSPGELVISAAFVVWAVSWLVALGWGRRRVSVVDPAEMPPERSRFPRRRTAGRTTSERYRMCDDSL